MSRLFFSFFIFVCVLQAIEAAGHKPHVVNCSWDIREGLLDLTHSKSVPNIWLKGKYVGGCNDGPEPWMGIKKIINNGKLGEFLQ